MDWNDHICIDTDVLVGKPVIKGTRIAVEFIMDLLAQGWTEQNILENYPGITHEDIISCLRYAEQVIKTERVYVLET
ncbi:MAG: DUF433 domain-containing protein [Deltaproteobacteria bacterium]|nr:DUF433 domain-containing protein [Deltaproteobacteria bacterium]